jgi:caa(3)-type oxidase subunit IV
MSEQSQAISETGDGHGEGHVETNYVKIWAWLVGLLAVSVAGPFLEIFWLTMVTAFGIACVKAWMVAKHFMHITLEPRFVGYIVTTSLVFMLLFFAAAAPDVMNAEGTQWVKPSWLGLPE